MIGRAVFRRRAPLKRASLQERAQLARLYVARHRGLGAWQYGKTEVALRAFAVGVLFGLALVIAEQSVVAGNAAIEQLNATLGRLLPDPVIDRERAPTEVSVARAAPILDSFERVTKESRLVVSGRVPSFALGGTPLRIDISVNGAVAASPATAADGSFSATVALANGANTIVVAVVRGSERAEAAPRVVMLDTEPPRLDVTRPQDGATIAGPNVVVQGKTEVGGKVTVNGHATGVTADGGFSDTFQARPGSLTIDVVARDPAGNEKKETLRVTVTESGVSALRVAVLLDRTKVRIGQRVNVDVVVSESGSAAPGATVALTVGLATVATGRTDSTGSFEANFLAPSTEGFVQVVAHVTDAPASGSGSATLEVTR